MPVPLSNTAFAYSYINLRGYCLDAAPRDEIFVPLISNVYSTIYFVKVLEPPQDLMFSYSLSYLYLLMILPGLSSSVW